MVDFSSLWVLAWVGMKVGFIVLVSMCTFSCCLLNQLLSGGCSADFLAKDSDYLTEFEYSLLHLEHILKAKSKKTGSSRSCFSACYD